MPASQQGHMFRGGSAGKHEAEGTTGMADTVKASTPIKLWCLCHIYLQSQCHTGVTEFLTQIETRSSPVLHIHHSFPIQESTSMCQNPLHFTGHSFTPPKGNFHQESPASHGKPVEAVSEETAAPLTTSRREQWTGLFYTM